MEQLLCRGVFATSRRTQLGRKEGVKQEKTDADGVLKKYEFELRKKQNEQRSRARNP